MEFRGLDSEAARAFAEKWLPAWSGNRPEYLVSFYTEDAYYADPAVPEGVRGRAALSSYFTKLLGHNPNWVWTHRGSIPVPDGFLNRWHASIPVGTRTVEVEGVCTVQLRGGLIYSNEVFFDRSELLRAIEALRMGVASAYRHGLQIWPTYAPHRVSLFEIFERQRAGSR